ncbi:MAG TPA: hypothetical protein VFT64_10040 [Rickettsiales bacterium]|nr:hypothetical protein [Rickettsiales bacterium]
MSYRNDYASLNDGTRKLIELLVEGFSAEEQEKRRAAYVSNPETLLPVAEDEVRRRELGITKVSEHKSIHLAVLDDCVKYAEYCGYPKIAQLFKLEMPYAARVSADQLVDLLVEDLSQEMQAERRAAYAKDPYLLLAVVEDRVKLAELGITHESAQRAVHIEALTACIKAEESYGQRSIAELYKRERAMLKAMQEGKAR